MNKTILDEIHSTEKVKILGTNDAESNTDNLDPKSLSNTESNTPTKSGITEKENGDKENKKPRLPNPMKNIPTPFKNSLFWPEVKNNEKLKELRGNLHQLLQLQNNL